MPGPLSGLLELAYDLTWVWTERTRQVFERVDPHLWELTHHNPVRTLALVSHERLNELAADRSFVEEIEHARASLRGGANAGAWFKAREGELPRTWRPFLVAYFCAEFGLTECLQIYSGGLGLLAGDHLRSCAQMGLPLVGVGLLYRNGYFHQSLDGHGTQQELMPGIDPDRQPVRRVIDGSTGRQLRVAIRFPQRDVQAAVWRADVGTVRLYLLDTDIDENSPHDRQITSNLYLGDQTRRIEQEIVLGIGGVRALEACGEHASVYHMNEGHAAFLALERIRMFRATTNATFDQAREAAAPSHVFTTHTPVPAGIDRFSPSLVTHYLGDYLPELGLDGEGLMALGREDVANRHEAFSMAVLALRTSRLCNGVSRLHGEVSRRMWRNIWPETPISDVPIGHVTNGVHTDFWVGRHVADLFDRHVSSGWRERPTDAELWKRSDQIPDAELWRARGRARSDLVRFCHDQMAAGRTGGIAACLDPNVLTVGFARRFAGYKRATLLLRDPHRLAAILRGHRAPGPVQLVISGKSHPGDGWGKMLIREIVEFARSPLAGGRVLFVEDYSIQVARAMVQGCDVWLNTPIRGLEASGTSGMKAAMNGVLNASVRDGWWDEVDDPESGFDIEARGTYPNDAPDEDRETFESEALYRLLESRIVPEFYTRSGDSADAVPPRWLARMRASIASLLPAFSTHRMIEDYAERYYFPAHLAASALLSTDQAGGHSASVLSEISRAGGLADQISRWREHWARVDVVECSVTQLGERGEFSASATIRTGGLAHSELLVEGITGTPDATGRLDHVVRFSLGPAESNASRPDPDGFARFAGRIKIDPAAADRTAVIVRVLPSDDRLVNPFIPGLIRNGPLVPLAHTSMTRNV
ncbi:MAG: alpha-glucan family phosphorylase [Phycisphaeraceae bacterium]|nr:alpha-glucan family phosphorylase [Phycisphaeraceae bacterium]